MNPDLFYPLQTTGPEYDGDDTLQLFVHDLGRIHLPSGKVLACDPLSTLSGAVVISCPTGSFPVKVTVADASEAQNGSQLRHAYLSILFTDAKPAEFRAVYPEYFTKAQRAKHPYMAVKTTCGSVGFVDADAASVFVESATDADYQLWSERVANPEHFFGGAANITLSTARHEENVCVISSGWGNGTYPVIGGVAADGTLISLHIDLLLVGSYRYETEDDD